MKVRELIERLNEMDPERLVVMSRDPEGNGFDTLHTMEECMYRDGETGLQPEDLTPELRKSGYSEDDVMEDGERAVCLWP